MTLSAIVFCVVIWHACVDSQRVEIGVDVLKYNKENAKKARPTSLDAIETNNEDQYIRSKDAPASVQPSGRHRNETETSEKLLSAVAPMTAASEVNKSGNLGRRVMDLWSFLKHSHQHISANRYPVQKVERSFLRSSSAIYDADFAINARRSFRTKRDKYEGDWRGIYSSLMWHRPGFSEQAERSAEKEKKLIHSLATSGTAPDDVLDEYEKEKNKERKLVYKICKEDPAAESLRREAYTVLLKDTVEGKVYEFDDYGIRASNPAFFDTPSPALTKFKAIKQKEFDTIDSFLSGPGTGDIYERQTGNAKSEKPEGDAEGDATKAKAEGSAEGAAKSEKTENPPKSDRDSKLLAISMKEELMNQMGVSADVEARLVDSLEKKGGASNYLVDEYKSSKSIERKILKDVVAEAKEGKDTNKPEVYIENYKLWIRDSACDNYKYDDWKIRANHTAFFDTPSPLRDMFFAMKRKEYDTLDGFLNGGPDVYALGDEIGKERSVNEFKEPPRRFGQYRKQKHEYYMSRGARVADLSRAHFNSFGCMSKKVLDQIVATAGIEYRLLDSLEKTGTVATDLFDQYKAAKQLEMKYAYEQYALGQIVNDNKDCKVIWYLERLYRWGLLADGAEEYLYDQFYLYDNHTALFDKPNAARTIYFGMKRLEYHTYFAFVWGNISDLYEGQPKNIFEEGATEAGEKSSDRSKTETETETDFESSKQKREAGSWTPRIHAQNFVICLCMVIGHVIVNIIGVTVGEDGFH